MAQTGKQELEFIDPRPGLARRARLLREEQGLSIRKLALMIDVNKNLINDIELGKANPTLLTLAKLSAGLGVTLPELIEPDNQGR